MSDLDNIKKHYENILPEDVNKEIDERLNRLEREIDSNTNEIKSLISFRKKRSLSLEFSLKRIINSLYR